jgi:putative phage-type endonuclease
MNFSDRIINVEQGTPEWKAARCGKVTASRIKDILAKGKSGAESASRADYRVQLVCEWLSDEPQEDPFSSRDMDHGIEFEPYARGAYGSSENVSVDQVGMILHPRDARCAASPDGLVDWWDAANPPKGLVEIKCPKAKTHIAYLLAGGVPSRYIPQMQWQMACTGAEWVDFVSYTPDLKGDAERLNLYICRLERDENRIREIEMEVARFLSECDALYNQLLN